MKIVVIGIGYVGLSAAVLLSQKYEVVAVDISELKVASVNKRICPFKDDLIEEYLSSKCLKLTATTDLSTALKDSDFVIVATPTNFNETSDCFETDGIKQIVGDVLELNSSVHIVIKSTIPVGFVRSLRNLYSTSRILFAPEFLREGQALYDNLYPSRIIVGDTSDTAQLFANIMLDCSLSDDVPILLTEPEEAEAIKLFSNTYLAMRVAFFNEVDSFAIHYEINPRQIISGMSLDPRIGDGYNNPSFGYGGYCLPKDTKQMLSNFGNLPQELISAIVTSNKTRKNYLTEVILARKPRVVGVYRLIMKAGSDNFRESAVVSIIELLIERGISVIVYEPACENVDDVPYSIVNNLEVFKSRSDLILANRASIDLEDVPQKLLTRDLFGEN